MNDKQAKAKSALALRHINASLSTRVQEDGRLHINVGDQDYLVSTDGRIYDATNATWVKPLELLEDLTREFESYHRYDNLDTEPTKDIQ